MRGGGLEVDIFLGLGWRARSMECGVVGGGVEERKTEREEERKRDAGREERRKGEDWRLEGGEGGRKP